MLDVNTIACNTFNILARRSTDVQDLQHITIHKYDRKLDFEPTRKTLNPLTRHETQRLDKKLLIMQEVPRTYVKHVISQHKHIMIIIIGIPCRFLMEPCGLRMEP